MKIASAFRGRVCVALDIVGSANNTQGMLVHASSDSMVFYVNHDGYNGQPDHNEVGAKEKVYFFHVKIYTGAIFTKKDLCIQKCMHEVTTTALCTVQCITIYSRANKGSMRTITMPLLSVTH